MQLSTFVVSVLLAIPALVDTAPTTPADANNALLPREKTCNAPKPDEDDTVAVKKYDDLMAKMSAATKAAHGGQSACKSTSSTDFLKSKDKTKRTLIKKKCVDGYQKYVSPIGQLFPFIELSNLLEQYFISKFYTDLVIEAPSLHLRTILTINQTKT
jgi:hypothetical protein